jgi:hypothetical protein
MFSSSIDWFDMPGGAPRGGLLARGSDMILTFIAAVSVAALIAAYAVTMWVDEGEGSQELE